MPYRLCKPAARSLPAARSTGVEQERYLCMYVKIRRHQHTRTQAHGATPELRRVADTTSHGLSAGRHSTQTTIGSPSLCGRPKGGRGRERWRASCAAPPPSVLCGLTPICICMCVYIYIYVAFRFVVPYRLCKPAARSTGVEQERWRASCAAPPPSVSCRVGSVAGGALGVGALWDCVPRVCSGGGGCASGGVPLGAVPVLSWCGEVSLGGIRSPSLLYTRSAAA